jgi:uncharacterized membrane protein
VPTEQTLKQSAVAPLPDPKVLMSCRVALGLIAISSVVFAVLPLVAALPAHWHWTDTAWLVVAALTNLVCLTRHLPLQNACTVGLIVGGLGMGAELLNAKTGMPFGARVFTDCPGPKLFALVPWPAPLLWMIVVINARGVARLVLTPWKNTELYGFWVIGVACLLAIIFQLMLVPVATQLRHWWHSPVAQGSDWFSVSARYWIGYVTTVLAMLVAATPWLISKHPGKRLPDHAPAITWMLLSLVFTVRLAFAHLWSGAAVAACSLLASGAIVVASLISAKRNVESRPSR